VSARLNHPAFAKILARRGSAVIEEWIPGRPLSDMSEIPRSLIRACGLLLAEVHTTELPATRWGSRVGSKERIESIVQKATTHLRDLDCIHREDVLQIEEAVQRLMPSEHERGFVHHDLAPENVIYCCDSAVRVIDHANFDVCACDLDLARTWYRWPLVGEAEVAFFEGYRERRDPDPYRAHFSFWALAVLLRTASFRQRARLADADVPRSMLFKLLALFRTGRFDVDPDALRP